MAVMALLSSGKVHLFDDNFLSFVQYLVKSCYNIDDNRRESRDLADKASFIIDHITTSEVMDFKKNLDIDYIKIYQNHMNSPDLDHDFMLSTENINFLP